MTTACHVQLYNHGTRTYEDTDGFSFRHDDQNGYLFVSDSNGNVDRLCESFYKVIYVSEFDYFVCSNAKMADEFHPAYPLQPSGSVDIGFRLFKKPPPPQYSYSDKEYKELCESHEYYYQLHQISGFQSYYISGSVIDISVKRVTDDDDEEEDETVTVTDNDDTSIPAPWLKMKNPKGGFYYYNTETGNVQFERPEVKEDDEENQDEDDESWLRLKIKYKDGTFEHYSLEEHEINYIE
jgi:hypothetical protein